MNPRHSGELYIGLMCGTSADAIDAAIVDWQNPKSPQLLSTHSHILPAGLRENLLDLNNNNGKTTLRALMHLDTQVATAHSDAVKALLGKHVGDNRLISAIGFHGQTVDHAPAAPSLNSLQLGNAQLLATQTGIKVIADVRRADIALGGQGAPLAPALHACLLQNPKHDIAVANIGGIANLSLIPSNPDQAVRGFDTGPGNCLMDEWSKQSLLEPFDRDGEFAHSGKVDPSLLEHWLLDEYFGRPSPKSTGRDHFNAAWLDAGLSGKCISPQDVQATLCMLTAKTIARELERHMPQAGELLICGGGAHNTHLMRNLSGLLPELAVQSTESAGIHPDWMEALLMSWLARQYCHGKTANLPSVTGASQAVRLGVKFDPPQAQLF